MNDLVEFYTSKGPILMDSADLDLLLSVDGLHRHKPYLEGKGYAVIWKGGHREYLHRLVMGAKVGQCVDHINGNRRDCRRSNLRLATKAQNSCNRSKTRVNQSGFKGVCLCKATGKWRAEIRADGKVVRIGRFIDKIDAARAYDAAAKRIHGEFARTNFLNNGDS